MSRSHGLFRLSEKIFNTPQFMTQDTFQNLTSYIVDRNTGALAWQVNIDEKSKEAKVEADEAQEIVLDIDEFASRQGGEGILE